jgi:hypothetical protein
MGVIAVAVYPEKRRFWPHRDQIFSSPWQKDRSGTEGKLESRSKAAAPSAQSEAMDSAGTGYGREEYSPSYRVSFNPERKAAESILIKYEWRQTLCKMNIIHCCGLSDRYSSNRIWENDGYAPPPPWRR